MLIATMEEKRATRTGKLLLLLAFLLLMPLGAVAQIITVKGTVIDSQGETVIGASVVEKGNVKNATITDLDGNFTLKVALGNASNTVPSNSITSSFGRKIPPFPDLR